MSTETTKRVTLALLARQSLGHLAAAGSAPLGMPDQAAVCGSSSRGPLAGHPGRRTCPRVPRLCCVIAGVAAAVADCVAEQQEKSPCKINAVAVLRLGPGEGPSAKAGVRAARRCATRFTAAAARLSPATELASHSSGIPALRSPAK